MGGISNQTREWLRHKAAIETLEAEFARRYHELMATASRLDEERRPSMTERAPDRLESAKVFAALPVYHQRLVNKRRS